MRLCLLLSVLAFLPSVTCGIYQIYSDEKCEKSISGTWQAFDESSCFNERRVNLKCESQNEDSKWKRTDYNTEGCKAPVGASFEGSGTACTKTFEGAGTPQFMKVNCSAATSAITRLSPLALLALVVTSTHFSS